jgi:protein-disulfide isomerase
LLGKYKPAEVKYKDKKECFMKQVIIAVLAVVAIIGGAVVLGKDEQATGQTSNHIYGKADSTVTLVEYGDFECPACKFFYPIVGQVKEKYKDKISFQYKNFPLVQVHRNALAAHRAAEAAGKQNKFFEMYDLLYSNQEDWNGPSQTDPVGLQTDAAIRIFESFAEKLNLDMAKYREDVKDASTSGTINADTAEGKDKYAITGTPTFVINGKKIEDTSTMDTVEELSALIDKELGIDTTEAAPANTETPAATAPEQTTQQ